MLGFLYELSDAALFGLLSSFFIIFSIVSVVSLRYCFPHSFRYRDNAVLGNVAALIGIIYGVLAGLTALYLITNITTAGDAVQNEANAVANLYRDTQWIKPPAQTEIRNQLHVYIEQVVGNDWAMMAKGKKVDANGDHIISKVVEGILHTDFSGPNGAILSHDMVEEAKALYNARQLRINASYAQLSPEIWKVILVGTFLTLFINYLFKMNFYLHLVSVTAAGLMAAAMIYLLVTLDKPFQGDFVVTPDSFQVILDQIQQVPPLSNAVDAQHAIN